MIALIVAIAANNVIGASNQLAWYLPADLARFKQLTTGHHIIMGRKTYESIGRALPNRTSVVITRQKEYKAPGCIVVDSIEAALEIARHDNSPFIIGGGQIYMEALPYIDIMYITTIHHAFEGDTHFPALDESVWREIERVDYEPSYKNNYKYSFSTLIRR